MDSMDALRAAQLAATQAPSTYSTSTSPAADAAGTTFDELLASVANEMSQTGDGTKAREMLFSGLWDGSLEVTDSQKLVSAIISTIQGEDPSSSSSSDLSSMNSSAINAMWAGQQNQNSVLAAQIGDMIQNVQQTGEEDPAEGYYQALAALSEVHKKLLGY